MADFVALYRGRTISEAEIVAVSAEPCLVERFFTELVNAPKHEQVHPNTEHRVPALEIVRGDEG